MKIGILTFHNAHNYGAVLQCWSLQTYLEKEGHEVVIINYRQPSIDASYALSKYKIKKKFGSYKLDKIYNAFSKKYQMYCARKEEPEKAKQHDKFEDFINHKLHVTNVYYDYEELKLNPPKCDAYIAGSDQIWNPDLTGDLNETYLLQFGKKETLRISYAASLGKTEIIDSHQMYFAGALRNFDAVSVREKAAKTILQDLTAREIVEVADPTFLLEKKDFESLMIPAKEKSKYIYVHNVHISIIDERLNAIAEELSRRLDIPVIHNKAHYEIENQKGVFQGGVEEYLGMIHNAEYVVTNSFHTTVFSLIFHKEFITVPHRTNPERMRHLLSKLGLEAHLIDQIKQIPENLKELEITYDKVDEEKKQMKQDSIAFLHKALSQGKEEYKKNYFEFADKYTCYGCQACKSVCPVNAIKMEVDKDGFPYPLIDESKCINCNQCERVCIYHNSVAINDPKIMKPEVYAAYHKNDEIVRNSSSGGAFAAICQLAEKKNALVIGVTMDKSQKVRYEMVDAKNAWKMFTGSKYVFASSDGLLERTRMELEAGKEIWFQGTPCEIAGLNSFLGKKYDNLTTVEIICHGTGSPRVFEKYCKELEELYQSKIVDFQFREQFKGKDIQFLKIGFASGSMELERSRNNDYQRSYSANLILRPSCYQCEFAGLRSGVADLTIGDYWGIENVFPEFDNEIGVSLIKVNTLKGKKIFEDVSMLMDTKKSTYKDAYKKNHRKPVQLTVRACRFLRESEDEDLKTLLKRYQKIQKTVQKGNKK
ncbi:MAG: polysaccharide pyruvyl transferase family protein [Anaerostipes sp.]|nr:polysaccharide pyruvyl transferase family protein [Anaerostipes sp.]